MIKQPIWLEVPTFQTSAQRPRPDRPRLPNYGLGTWLRNLYLAKSTITQSISESITESIPESITESIPESIRESIPESIRESITESITESIRGSGIDYTIDSRLD